MSHIIKIKKGLDIPLAGYPQDLIEKDTLTKKYAVVPEDYPGYIWKVLVKPGEKVFKGSPLFYAKEDESLHLVSPVNGIVDEIKRGERRKIEFISIISETGDSVLAEKTYASKDILLRLKETGLFALIRQRPFDIVAQPDIKPRDIFVTAFDTAPLAGKMLTGSFEDYLENGLRILSQLTDGKVYLSVPKGSQIKSETAKIYEFEGPHPAGNVGVQIANIKPVNKGETVWTLDAVSASRIGKYFKDGMLDFSAVVAVTGPDVKNPCYVETTVGASLATLLKGRLIEKDSKIRVISGNVLTGHHESLEEGFLRYPYRQITVIDEGDDADEFMGWASLSPNKYSVKRSFPAFLKGLSKPFHFDARIKGGHRAMIMSGEYDKVFPMDIYPEYLVKAIMAKDIERMEQLGIYEVAPEDFALPEFVDTSKLELQKIVRDGLDYLRKETI